MQVGRTRPRLCLALLSAAVLLDACAAPGSAPAAGGPVRVVAAENSWGSIAAQLGGDRVKVTTLVRNPATDPHSYEPVAADARAVASARFVIYNGVGYDPWAPELVRASSSHPTVLDVGRLVGVKAGANPHRWYSPADVDQVIAGITADYKRLSPGDAAYFDEQASAFLASGLARYRSLIAEIRAGYRGTPVGASESIFAPLADALGLSLLTPASFLDAISEGGEPTAADKATIDAQIRDHRIRVYVFNAQNATPDVGAQLREARAAGIPTVSITETLSPPGATFQGWQAAQLAALQVALAQGSRT